MANSLPTALRSRPLRESRRSRPSVREVCLLGVSTTLSAGDRLNWSGRSYRVEASHPGYAHLAANSEPTGAS